MAMSGNLRITASLSSPYHHHHHHLNRMLSPSSSKVDFTGFTSPLETSRCPEMVISRRDRIGQMKVFARDTGDYEILPNSTSQEIENFLMNTVNLSFMDRVNLAWKIIFPSQDSRRSSGARIAKQRLKMILFSDRCAVSDEAKRKIVNNIVHALSDFVEIESEEKVQLNVSTDADLGTMYSVTVPVRRVKPEYMDMDEAGAITNVEYKDTEDGSVDVKFDFYIPS